MRIQCLIVDDEPYAIDLIAHHIASFDDMEVAGRCKNVQEAVNVLHSSSIDLMFLDVNMPDIDGISFLKSLQSPPAVILTTAYREYALEGFELGVIDYLLKPISFLRFAKAIDRYRNFRQSAANVDREEQKPLMIKSGYEYNKVLPADILYIQSKKDYAEIVTHEKRHLVRATMKALLEQLPRGSFMQVHKSFIVPVTRVSSVSTKGVFIEGISIPVGRSYMAMIKETLGK